jgi:hypothetical protein
MRYWYYHESGQQKGPVDEDAFVKLFESGSLAANTLVWCEWLKDWQEARTIENLVPPSFASPPAPVHRLVVPPPLHDFVPTGPQARPWVRYWARTIDVMLFAILAGVLLAFIDPAALEINDKVLGTLFIFLYVFIEPCMLSSWGTTPGKALLNIRLRKSDGTKLNFSEALARAFNVWIRGWGLGLPIVALFTQIIAYNRLTKEGITSWDKDGGFRIDHKLVGAGRVIAVIVLFVGFFFLIALDALGTMQ